MGGITNILILKWGTSKPRPDLVQVVSAQVAGSRRCRGQTEQWGSVSEEKSEIEWLPRPVSAPAEGRTGGTPVVMQTWF